MAYLALTDPFPIHFKKDDQSYAGMVTYAKKDDCSGYFFDVVIHSPEGLGPIRLQEKPTLNPEYDHMVWVDDNSRVSAMYQQIGDQIELELKKLGVFLIDAPITNQTNSDDGISEHEE